MFDKYRQRGHFQSLLRAAHRGVSIHLCPAHCSRDEVGDRILNAKSGRVILRLDEGPEWVRSLEAVKPGAVADELSGLRARADAVAPCPPGAVEIRPCGPVKQFVRKSEEEKKKKAKCSKEKSKETKKKGKSKEKDSDRMNGKHPMSAVSKTQRPRGHSLGALA